MKSAPWAGQPPLPPRLLSPCPSRLPLESLVSAPEHGPQASCFFIWRDACLPGQAVDSRVSSTTFEDQGGSSSSAPPGTPSVVPGCHLVLSLGLPLGRILAPTTNTALVCLTSGPTSTFCHLVMMKVTLGRSDRLSAFEALGLHSGGESWKDWVSPAAG
ncbi:hypothetical protein HJG60_007759 [Phyllostomus discolor]|uniref:Uncharacterized protein n=1 Tax=Phyllostomus discolor TaxID=89673 RepID=A0A834EV28_9CHIR|nr:hypothetical protein HJG60_007759 [Phyllostomus discolor]